ncbi:MAG: hypothetical protein VX252_07975 [Myxococcota bacterium]|nr:hypothetical protein [Myxococcota bacterium]
MAKPAESPALLLENSLRSERIHSAYLISGAGDAPLAAALQFARGLVCEADPAEHRPCEACPACRRSQPAEDPIPLAAGKDSKGPRFRQIGDHADLYWVERAQKNTQVRIDQVRELHTALSRRSHGGGRRAAIITDAQWLNASAESALLRLLEEPPSDTSLILVAPVATKLMATIRSRCVRVTFPAEESRILRGDDVDGPVAEVVEKLDGLNQLGLSDLIEWAEDYRGDRGQMAESVDFMLAVAGDWLSERIRDEANETGNVPPERLDAYKTLLNCRQELTRRNASPQMTAERSLFALRAAVSR